jgi:phosphoribosylanthranilate isomerase
VASADHPEECEATRKVRVKISGITNADDAAAAIAFRADALGYNCYRGSKRYLNLATATHWLWGVPETVKRIAVLVNPTWQEAATIAALPFIDGL